MIRVDSVPLLLIRIFVFAPRDAHRGNSKRYYRGVPL
jgi:hypothetical protein